MRDPQIVGKVLDESEIRWPHSEPDPHKKPNVVVIVLDDVGFGQIGCYGSSINTPSMDALASGGVRYSCFHTTSLCSPTRASLLTGRNHHSVGMGNIPELVGGYPGYHGVIPPENGMLSEILLGKGYNTFAVGKWHLTPDYEQTSAGPFDRWPLGRGFERYYGFLMGMIDHWHPGALAQDNQFVDVPGGNGYHLSVDLVDHAIKYVGDAHVVDPHKPFFLYMAFGAGHSPHHAPTEYSDAYKGFFDHGWDIEREKVLARQKELGIMAHSVGLPDRNPGVSDWSSLTADQKRVYARMQEVFAGFMTHTDAQIGRFVQFLHKINRLDDTLVILISDNGASMEGGDNGVLNEYARHNGLEVSFEKIVADIDKIGAPGSLNNYPKGWSMAGNTPFRDWKRYTYQGGIADPLIIHWPDKIKDRGAIRSQYHHVTDLLPTVLDALEIEPPDAISGVQQSAIEGVSMWYSIDDPDVTTKKQIQYYEMLGARALYYKGWKAVAEHVPMSSTGNFNNDRWELFYLPDDPNETNDLSEMHPDIVRDLVDRWWIEAGRYNVLPLDDRGYERWPDPRPIISQDRNVYEYFPNTQPVFGRGAVDTLNRDFNILATVVNNPNTITEGVILAHGNRFGGHTLFIKDENVYFVYNLCGVKEYRVSAPYFPVDGEVEISVIFKITGESQGEVTLIVGDSEAVSGSIEALIPYVLPVHSHISCGLDRGLSVCADYDAPFTFTDIIESVKVSVGQQGPIDHAKVLQAILSEQ
tara:strand:+ start:58669 stop:60927 length:2259 start_codon:yes stop_codon:yes gene_type:complete